ncbi:hypothetical protein ACFL3D_04630, partial [Candidatus Omnitrophota bacterium]
FSIILMKKTNIILSSQRLDVLTRSLKIGDVVEGTVVTRLGKDRYLVSFQGHNFIASYQGFLKRNSSVQTIVQQVNPQVVFKILAGYSLPIKMHEHEKNLRKVIQGAKGAIILKPHCSELCNELRIANQALKESGIRRWDMQPLIRAVDTLLKKVTFIPREIRSDQFIDYMGAYIRMKSNFSLTTIMNAFEKIETILNDVKDEDYDQRIENIGCVGECLKKIYLNVRLERLINCESEMKKRGISYFEIPYFGDAEYEKVLIYFWFLNDATLCIKLIHHTEGTTEYNLVYDREKQLILYNDENFVDAFEALHIVMKQAGIAIKKDNGPIFDEDQCLKNSITIDMMKPVKFDFVI